MAYLLNIYPYFFDISAPEHSGSLEMWWIMCPSRKFLAGDDIRLGVGGKAIVVELIVCLIFFVHEQCVSY